MRCMSDATDISTISFVNLFRETKHKPVKENDNENMDGIKDKVGLTCKGRFFRRVSVFR